MGLFSSCRPKTKKVHVEGSGDDAPPARERTAVEGGAKTPGLNRQGTSFFSNDKTVEPAPGCGHVFVLHCAATGLAADALLVPLRESTPRQSAKDGEPNIHKLTQAEADKAGYKGVTLVYEGQITTRFYSNEAEAIAGAMKVVHEYLDVVGAALKGQKSGFKRAKPLVALPMPGVGLMDEKGLIEEMKEIVRPLLFELYAKAMEYELDFAVATVDHGAFHVAQVLREHVCPFAKGPFWMLPENLRKEAHRLQEQAASGRLGVLFGAGVSFPSGLPSWGGLLQKLSDKAGYNEKEFKDLCEMGLLDQATLIEEKMMESGLDFNSGVAECVAHGRYTPAHSIIGTLHLPAVTTNYDRLYEQAVESQARRAEENVFSLPWDAAKVSRLPGNVRRLLKLHGCVAHPESIVLSRADYMRYEDHWRAMRGVVHQNLMERELLILGFSMTDDNVHLIIDQVRKVVHGTDPQVLLKQQMKSMTDVEQAGAFMMGTVVTLVENSMFRKLWDQDFAVVSCADSWEAEHNPAWIHDIFLDSIATNLVLRTAFASFVLNPSYESLLNPAQQKMKEALAPLHALLKDETVTSSRSWRKLEAVLRDFGAPELDGVADNEEVYSM